ncbi:MAG: sulfatase-like hydrolase/transferase [Deltaproteobacteria bacterium]|nr:sulfatase-like hydrolase/transferase [Deltaproteobacteria bacterium]
MFAHYFDPQGKSKSRRFMNDVRPGDPGYRLAFYDSAIHFVDAQLKRVFDALQDAGWAESTLVILVSDHGEELGEHGAFGHKSTLYRESLMVPLVIRYPRVIEADQTVEVPASLLDIFPTVLDLVGLEPPAGLQGTSLLP